MKFIITLALLALGSSLSFYYQAEVGYVICLVLIFITGHYAGYVSNKVQTQLSGEHAKGGDNCVYRQDLLWLIKEITSPIHLDPSSKEAQAIVHRLEQIKKRLGLIGR